MPNIRLDHFKRAAADVGAHGDNDMLPFDIDNRFVRDNEDVLAEIAFAYSQELAKLGGVGAKNSIESLPLFSERLLAPAGAAGFRIATKIHPFWNIYFNGLGIAVGEILEPGLTHTDSLLRALTSSIGRSLGERFERPPSKIAQRKKMTRSPSKLISQVSTSTFPIIGSRTISTTCFLATIQSPHRSIAF